MTEKQAQKVLDELNEVRAELLNDEAKRLFEAIMKIANEKDELKKKAEEQDKIIGEMIDNIMIHYQLKTIRKMCCPTCRIEKTCTYSGIHRNCIKQYFENKAKEVE